MTDKELLELAAKAAAIVGTYVRVHQAYGDQWVEGIDTGAPVFWNPLTDDGDRYRLAKHLGISIDFSDCCAWKRFTSGRLIQEFWGGDCGDEAHAVVRAAAEIARTTDTGGEA
ncbi:hypothetical protein [Burkholderia glumae]|uniref:hypothetical protein n=1 Tax=Burkholderia glumae TaxID=337 RepID=UPI00214FB7F6|nr:hypothetical protein [Burkholderia glumae]